MGLVKTSFIVSTEGGVDIEAVAIETPDLVHSIGITASVGCTDADAATLADALNLTGTARDSGMILFKTLYDAFKVSGESSALEFLSSEGASYYLELTQDAAGEGLDLGDNVIMDELQDEIIEYLENN